MGPDGTYGCSHCAFNAGARAVPVLRRTAPPLRRATAALRAPPPKPASAPTPHARRPCAPPLPAARPPRRAARAAAASGEVSQSAKKPPKRGGRAKEHADKDGGGKAAGAAPPALGSTSWIEEWDDDDDEGEESFLAPYMDSVLKVYCVHTEPNHSMPWQRKRQYPSSSSGFVAAVGEQKWILTNAHSVKVKRRGDDRKFIARVLSVGADCDIALLTVDDPEFWEGVAALEFAAALPRLQDQVAVVGYPVGGESISITSGVVSRIEVTEYTHGSYDLLGVQIDAAINGGNSGGPVFNGRGQCVGIAFQALSGSDVENVGYVIPSTVVSHFLTDYVRNGKFTGFPALGVQWQRMESETLRRAYGMAPKQKGVLIRRVNTTSHAASVLAQDDVLLSFDGTAIACDGTVPFRTGERIAFSYLISQKFVGDEAVLEVLRGGQVLKLTAKLSKPAALVPPHLENRDPSYFIVSGLVLVACSEPFLESEYGADYAAEAPVKLLEQLYHGQPSQPGEEVVVLSQVLAADSTLGYEDVLNVQVLSFNGTRVHNLRHLAQLVTACTDPYLRFDCEYREAVVLDSAAAFADTAAVLDAHGIPAAVSPDLREGLPPWPPVQASSGSEPAGSEPIAAAA
ncbi:protease Do-like [Raphidocelis subcapitata]|uniref:Protease Do-like n=1 Tax=Raphidocelis subcapitata TaxID=307507 RepID=A0A2V0P0Y3_9CHLO|nr:protease Do-like [Raphidocelis subcapitata]|eukprot:GBF92582.1 protease Do-like [Raphidocelis subcapitata]